MYRLLIGGLTACVISGVAFAQAPPDPAMPKQYREMAAAMAAAQARAVRPGDEALGCAAIEKELMASMNDPAVQAYAATSAAAALQTGGPGRGASPQALAQALAAQPKPTPQQAQAAQALAAQQAAAMQQAMAAQQNLTPQQALAMQQALADPQVQAAFRAQQQALATPQAQAALAAQSAQLAQLQDPSAQLAMMTTVMPQMMRSQRLMGLAIAKGCPSSGAAPLSLPAKK